MDKKRTSRQRDEDDQQKEEVWMQAMESGFSTPPRHDDTCCSTTSTNTEASAYAEEPPQVHRVTLLNLPPPPSFDTDKHSDIINDCSSSPESSIATTTSISSSSFSNQQDLSFTNSDDNINNAIIQSLATTSYDEELKETTEPTVGMQATRIQQDFIVSTPPFNYYHCKSDYKHTKTLPHSKSTSFQRTIRNLPNKSNIVATMPTLSSSNYINRHKTQNFLMFIIQKQKVIVLCSSLIVCTIMFITFTKFHQMAHYYNITNDHDSIQLLHASSRNATHTKKKKKEPIPTLIDNKEALAKLIGTNKSLSEITWKDLHFQQEQPSMAPLCSNDTPLLPDQINFTLVTQVSEDRLWMLTQHCHRWPGPISAAVFTDFPASRIQQILLRENEVYGKCSLNQVTITTLTKAGVPEGEYPVNALRNLALQNVQTTHLFYADVDFWSSENLYETLHSSSVTTRLSQDDKLALVVPAFQMKRQCDDHGTSKQASTMCRLNNMEYMPMNRSEIFNLIQKENVTAFDPTNKGGHGSTLYEEWYLQQDGEVRDIPCISSNRYEPYVAVRYCRHLPPFQEVFTGYGKNKMTQIMQMRRTGYVFSQVGGVFVIHYPHHTAKARKAWSAGKRSSNSHLLEEETSTPIDWTQFKRGQVDKFFVEFRSWLNAAVEEKSRVEMCVGAVNDDENLWI